jgi:hypothetical protein
VLLLATDDCWLLSRCCCRYQPTAHRYLVQKAWLGRVGLLSLLFLALLVQLLLCMWLLGSHLLC